jgi:hypothetical protein
MTLTRIVSMTRKNPVIEKLRYFPMSEGGRRLESGSAGHVRPLLLVQRCEQCQNPIGLLDRHLMDYGY